MAKENNGTGDAAKSAEGKEPPIATESTPPVPVVESAPATVADDKKPPANAAVEAAIAEREAALNDGKVGVGFFLSNGKAPKESDNYLQNGFIMWLRTEKKNADRNRVSVKEWDELYKEYTGHKPSEGQKT